MQDRHLALGLAYQAREQLESLDTAERDVENMPREGGQRCDLVGISNLTIPERFAPSSDTVTISYQIHDPLAQLRSLTATVTGTDDVPLDLPESLGWDLNPGEHSVHWNGELPRGQLTVERSPYRLVVTTTASDARGHSSDSTDFRIEIAQLVIEFDIGPRRDDIREQDLRVLEDLLARELTVPTENTTVEVRLPSNIFFQKHVQMAHNDESSFRQYESQWGQGPRLPIRVRPKIWSLSGDAVDPVRSVGKVPVEIVVEEHPPFAPASSVAAASFIARYTVDGVCPPDYGGIKRPYVRSPSSPAADPNPEVHHTNRETGQVSFTLQLSRIAGSRCSLKACLPQSESISTETGFLEIWRQVDLLAHYVKSERIAELTLADAAQYLSPAFIRLEPPRVGRVCMGRDYESQIDRAMKEIDLARHDYSLADSQAQTSSAVALQGDLRSTLAVELESAIKQGVTKACTNLMNKHHSTGQGIVLFQFEGLTNIGNPGARGATPPGDGSDRPDRDLALQMLFGAPHQYYGRDSIESTLAHEIGHLLFLDHPCADGGDAKAHDPQDPGCLMSYNFSSARSLCGYCTLRLRGWNHTKFEAFSDPKPTIEFLAPQGSVECLDLGIVEDPAVPTRGSFTLRNSGDAPLIIHDISVGEPFRLVDNDCVVRRKPADDGETAVLVCNTPIAPGHSVELAIECQGDDRKLSRLTIHSNEGPKPTSMQVIYRGIHSTLGISEPTEFAYQFPGDPVTQTLILTCEGRKEIDEMTFECSPPWHVVEPIPSTVPPAGAQLVIAFAPDDPGKFLGRLAVSHRGKSTLVALSGHTVASQALERRPAELTVVSFDRRAEQPLKIVLRKGKTLIIVNDGDELLTVTATIDGNCNIDGETSLQFNLEARAAKELLVAPVDTCAVGTAYVGTLTLQSNDRQVPSMRFNLCGTKKK